MSLISCSESTINEFEPKYHITLPYLHEGDTIQKCDTLYYDYTKEEWIPYHGEKKFIDNGVIYHSSMI